MFLRRFAAVALLAASSVLAPPLHAQVVREKVAVEVLTVRLTASDRSGRPVEDLSPADLVLRVDEKPVAIETFGRSPGARSNSEGEPAASAAPMPRLPPEPRRPTRTLVFADEGDTESVDRRVVYEQLERFFEGEGAEPRREIMVARFAGGRLEVTCPWTDRSDRAVSALRALRSSPAMNSMPSASGLPGSGTPAIWIQTYQERLHQALLEALAVFPDDPADRQLLLVTGGTVLMRPNDLIACLRCQLSEAERTRLRLLTTDVGAAHARDIERATFVLWSRAVNPAGQALTMSDIVAKAIERDVDLIPIAAEGTARGADLGMEREGVSLVAAGDARMSPRISAGQTMTEIAAGTGSQPILVPGKAAARFAELEALPAYTITFRDPAGDRRYHRIELACRRKGVTLRYRGGYRIPSDDERALDMVVAGLAGGVPGPDPLSATASLSPADSGGRRLTRLALRITPPRETAPPAERGLEFVALAESANGDRTEPVQWSGTAMRVEGESGTYAAAADLGVAYRDHRWSIAVRDTETGLTSFLLVSPVP